MEFPKDFIAEHDKEKLLESISSMPEQLIKGSALTKRISLEGPFSNIILAGMGGSFIAGFMAQRFLSESKIPMHVSHDYNLPKTLRDDSLVICVSYSGNTEETISCFRQALRSKCTLIGMSSGGKIKELCKLGEKQWMEIPSGLQPRASLGYQFSALLSLLEKAGIIKGVESVLKKASKSLESDKFSEMAIELSEKLVGKIPVIYSSEAFYPVSYRWKTQFNENSKIFAIAGSFSEQNHNEILAFANAQKQGNFHIVMLTNADDSSQIKKRMKLTKQVASEKGIDTTEISILGNDQLTKLLSAALIGDYTSYYLALRYGINPTEVKTIEWLKKQL